MYGMKLTVSRELCGECGGCVAVCPDDALVLESIGLLEIAGACTSCRLCIITCPSRALALEDEVKV